MQDAVDLRPVFLDRTDPNARDSEQLVRYPIYHPASGGHVFAPTSALAIALSPSVSAAKWVGCSDADQAAFIGCGSGIAQATPRRDREAEPMTQYRGTSSSITAEALFPNSSQGADNSLPELSED